MQICDRSWKRDGQPVLATTEITLQGVDVEEVYQLCAAEVAALRSFLNEPHKWQETPPRKGASRKVLRLTGAA